eukprot:c23119_g1_i2 orf=327-1820(-)
MASPSSAPTLPSLPANPSVTLPAMPSNPSITLPALPPYPHSTPPAKDHLNNTRNSSGNSNGNGNGNGNASSGPASHLTLIAVLGVLVTVTALILLWLLVFLIKRQKKKLEKPASLEASGGVPAWSKDILQSPKNPLRKWLRDSTTFRRFNHSEIQKATDNFSTIIGKGGFGTVYKAYFNDGLVAAVKRMYRVSRQREKEFCKEMEFLGRLHHRHLVTLRGFCITKTERFLVYEYMENGSLKEHLQAGHSKAPLDWRTRIQVAIDVAAALEYLHFFCEPPLCHRDIKSSNILLDQHFVAKVADFGLAHATPTPTSAAAYEQISTDVRGTPGYLDPEYVVTRQLTVKSDIYSYGVLLLELITGRGAVQDNRNLVSWSQPYLATDAKVPLMVDPDLEDNYDPEELRSLVKLLKMCTQKEGKSRPTIRQVLSFLYERLDKEGGNAMPTALMGNTQSGAFVAAGGKNMMETSGFSSTFSSNTHSTKAYRFDTTSVTSASEKQ